MSEATMKNQLLLIKKATNLETFLSAILECYQTNGIGQGLPIAELEAFLLGKAPLTEAWLQAIADNLCLDMTIERLDHAEQYQLIDICHALFASQPLESWADLTTRWLVLLAPLLDFKRILLWSAMPNQVVRHYDFEYEDNDARKVATGFSSVAQALATEEAGFGRVCQWLKNADITPNLWLDGIEQASLAAEAQRYHSYDANFHPVLSAFFCSLELLLRRGEPTESDWFALWSGFAAAFASLRELAYINSQALPQLLDALSITLLNQLIRWPLFIPHLAKQASVLPMNTLLDRLHLGVLLAQKPEDFKALIDGLADADLNNLRVTSALADASAALALYVMQQRFERRDPNASFFLRGVELSTPEALAYYQQVWPYLKSQDEVLQCVAWIAKSQTAQQNRQLLNELIARNPSLVPDALFGYVDEQAVLDVVAMSCYPNLQGKAIQNLFERALDSQPSGVGDFSYKYPNPERWPWLMALQQQYADLFIEHTVDGSPCRSEPLELQRLEVLWSLASSDAVRQVIACHLLDEMCFNCDIYDDMDSDDEAWVKSKRGRLIELMQHLFLDNSIPFFACAEERGASYLQGIVDLVSDGGRALLPLVPSIAVAHLTQSTWFSDGIEALSEKAILYINQALQNDVACYTGLTEKGKVKLLPFMDEAAVLACAADVAELLGHKTKNVYEPVIQRLAQCSRHTLEQSGWLNDTAKVLRKRLLLSIGLNTRAELLPLWHDLIDDKAHDDFSYGLMLDRLEASGEALAAKDPYVSMDLAAWQAYAKKQKIPATIQKLWQPALADCLKEWAEPLGPYLLSQLCSGNDQVMPRKARQLLALLPAGYCADLTEQLVNRWISENGPEKLNAFLLPLPVYGDERVANALVKACKAWKKTRKPKSSLAIRLLCQLPGSYGVSQAHLLWESRQFSDSIMRNAKQALTEVAQREGLSLSEFLEQLVPDLGLTAAGLVLDVGPYSYAVKIKPDLSFIVVDAKGKATKTLPKMKADEDVNKRSVADNQFKSLKKNLKPILKQQSQRLYRLMCVGKRWPVALWQRLFVQHPLMAIIAQGVVWSVYDPQGAPLLRFRPSDSGELLDLDDETVTLQAGQLIGVMHPIELDETERQAWQSHLDDYEITSPFGQLEMPVYQASDEELSTKRVTRSNKAMLNRGKFSSLMEKWGYLKGAAEDAAMVHEHSWIAVPDAWKVMCYHSPISVFFEADEEANVEALVPLRYVTEGGRNSWEEVSLQQLPKALLATLLSQAEALNAAKMHDLS